MTGIVLTAAILVAQSRYGSIGHALLSLRGERLVVDEAFQRLGPLASGEERFIPYEVTNLTNRDVRLLGSQTSCSCTMVDNLPATLGPRSSLTVRVAFEASSRAQDVTENVVLFTDCPGARKIRLGFSASEDRSPRLADQAPAR